MKVITEGHKYELENFEHPEKIGQAIQFIHKEPTKETHTLSDDGRSILVNPSVLETILDGTTDEEVLAVLIDRMNFLQNKFPCRENAIVITKLEESLMWLEKITNDIKKD